MSLLIEPIEIDPSEGFTRSKDIFSRRPFGEALTRLVKTLETPSTIMLDAPWGAGKSTFIKMWRGEIKKHGISSIYFDAFENDYQGDAFIALAAQLISELESKSPEQERAVKSLKTAAINTAKILGKATFHLAVKAASANLIDSEGLKEAAAETAKALTDEVISTFDATIGKRLEQHSEEKQSFQSFRNQLTAYADLSSTASQSNSAPLIFIIDELDRCKPNFAIEIIETLKHLFSTKNTIFLISCNMDTLIAAIHARYGSDINARTYLEKFYNFRILLPAPSPDFNKNEIRLYASHLGCTEDSVLQLLYCLSNYHNLSFRTLEHITTYYKLIKTSNPHVTENIPQLVALVCVIRVTDHTLYQKLRSNTASITDIDSFCRFNQWTNEMSGTREHVQEMLQGCFGALSREDQRSFSQGLARVGIRQPNPLVYVCSLADAFALP